MTEFMHKAKNQVRVSLLVVILLLGFLLFTNPNNLPILLLITPIFLLFVFLTSSISVVLKALHKNPASNPSGVSVYAVTFSFVTCLALLLRSIDQLNGKDILLIIILFVVSIFYIRHIRPSK